MGRSRDCIIIGGGVVGLSIAWRLAREKIGVTLLEQSVCGREASWAGAGVLSPANPHRSDAVAELQLRSIRAYSKFCEELRKATGVDPEFDLCHEFSLAFDDRDLKLLRDDVDAAGDRMMPDGQPIYELLSPNQARELVPAISNEIVGAMICRETAQVRNPRLLRALRSACKNAGVDIREGTPVRRIAFDGDRVEGVETDGGVLASRNVILCAGAWSSKLDQRFATLMPVHPVRGQMILLKLDQRPFRSVIARGRAYLVPRSDGHVLIGATEEPEAGFDKRCTPAGIGRLIEKGMQLSPSLADAPVAATWSGLRPGTKDDLPYLGKVPGFDGLVAATGHYRTGLTSAPATADFILSVIEDRPYDLDLTCAAPGRH